MAVLDNIAKRFNIIVWPKTATNYLRHRNNEWRKHPYLQTTLRSALPGIEYGFAAAVIYELGVYALGDDSHGHEQHGHGHNDKHDDKHNDNKH